jgi:5-methylcytosine-specific restriction enzyme subunit McrC
VASLVLREYARLGIGELRQLSIDEALVPESAFEWLCQESARLRKSGAPLVHIDGRRWLRLDNYVGVIETPCGVQIEILPKHLHSHAEASSGRRLLQRMLSKVWGLPSRQTGPAGIQAFNAPLTEWVMREFLVCLDLLVKRGLRFDYHPVREQQRFLRGRMLVSEQMRQPPGREHIFAIEHDVFDADRPENRLLRSALEKVCRATREPGNWRLSHELATYLASIPSSQNVDADFRLWRDDRLMAHYRPIRPWCELILTGRNPLAVAGDWRGLSLLFPMEKLFEKYVEVMLRSQLASGLLLTRTPSRKNLCEHLGSGWFNLQPDLMVSSGDRRWILDTKWKRIDEGKGNPRDKYDVSQADLYQLFAYGHKYLSGLGDVALIYPATATFTQPLPVFVLADDLRLWVLPFDLERGCILGLEKPGIAVQGEGATPQFLSA